MMLPEILSDGFFAAVAAIGFGAISDPPMRAFPVIALLAAVGSLLLGGRIRCPMTVLFIPALLPMIPGMYAYKTVFATIMFMQHLGDAAASAQYLQEILRNGFVTFCVIFMLAAGAAAPIFLFNKRAHSLTRDKKHISEQ